MNLSLPAQMNLPAPSRRKPIRQRGPDWEAGHSCHWGHPQSRSIQRTCPPSRRVLSPWHSSTSLLIGAGKQRFVKHRHEQHQHHIKRHPSQPFNNTGMLTMERGGGHVVVNILDSGYGVDNSVDREHVDFVDDREMLVQEPKQLEHYSITCNRNTKSIRQHSSSNGARTSTQNCKMGHEQHGHVGNLSLHHWPTGVQQDNIINTTAVGNITPRNTTYIFLLHYNCIQ